MRRAWMLGSLLFGCQYDYDKLYEHAVVTPDAGSDAGAQLASSQLISAWIGHNPSVDADCVACAEQKCASASSACEADASCAAFTRCVGADPTPAGQNACRAQQASWVNSGNVRERDLNGPYGQCVFRYNCAVECGDNSELWCAGGYTTPLTSSVTVPLHLYLTDAFDQTQPLPNVQVRVCSAQDLHCEHPDASGKTDERGLVELQLPTSFSRAWTGYLEITGNERYPTLLKFSWNVSQETTQLVGIVAETSFKQAIEVIGLTTDDTRGMLQLRMLGCAGNGVTGVSFQTAQADAASKTWYIVNGVPKLDANETTPVGSGGIIDVPAGAASVTATRKTDNVVVGRADVPVRAKFMSVVIFTPVER